jgi:aminocarboxymuconate-semialdehyde decarboxylase
MLLSHGGGSLVTLLPRMEYFRTRSDEARERLPEPVAAYARRLWYDPLVFDATLLRALVGMVGSDRVVFGTDYPFLDNPLAYLADVPDSLVAAIRGPNARRLLDYCSGSAGRVHTD